MEVTTTVVSGVDGGLLERVGAAHDRHVDALVVEHPGDAPGRPRGPGCPGRGRRRAGRRRPARARRRPRRAARARSAASTGAGVSPARRRRSGGRRAHRRPASASSSASTSTAWSRLAGPVAVPHRVEEARRCRRPGAAARGARRQRDRDLVGRRARPVLEPAALDLAHGERAEALDHGVGVPTLGQRLLGRGPQLAPRSPRWSVTTGPARSGRPRRCGAPARAASRAPSAAPGRRRSPRTWTAAARSTRRRRRRRGAGRASRGAARAGWRRGTRASTSSRPQQRPRLVAATGRGAGRRRTSDGTLTTS